MSDGPRVLQPDRAQLFWDMMDLESQIEADHVVRVIWAFVDRLELSELYRTIRARDDVAGRPTPDPKVLLALWLYATAEGIGSARALERLCRSHSAYRWLCGGVPVNYHGLSDFRARHGDMLDRILTESVASMAAAGLISLDEIAVDGTKVRANAGRKSFRKEAKLATYEAAAAARIARLKAERDDDPDTSNRRRGAAQARAAREIAERAAAASEQLEKLKAERAKSAKTHPKEAAAKPPAKASTTDPGARMMRMADKAVRPCYNVLVSAETAAQVIVGIDSAGDMTADFASRYGRLPNQILVDTRAATREEIVTLASSPGAVTVYTPPPERREDVTAGTKRQRAYKLRKEPAALKEWRARMATAEGAKVYKRRSRIETVNADLKNHGLRTFMLRGLAKVRAEALLHAIAHNIRRALSLGWRFA